MTRSIITLDDLTRNNLGTFKKINTVCLPTAYPDSWYTDSLNPDQIVKLAFYSELPVGAVKGKLINTAHSVASFEASAAAVAPKTVPNALYLESLAVLEAYRDKGVGSKLLDWLVEETKLRFVHAIVLHVHVGNTAALEWYKKRGFVQGDLVENYYKLQGLADPDAYVMTLACE